MFYKEREQLRQNHNKELKKKSTQIAKLEQANSDLQLKITSLENKISLFGANRSCESMVSLSEDEKSNIKQI